jgi:SPX domain protein involved in polyphosphate accumulation
VNKAKSQMKFGEYLRKEKVLEWQYSYLDYDTLKNMIKELEEKHLLIPQDSGNGNIFYF